MPECTTNKITLDGVNPWTNSSSYTPHSNETPMYTANTVSQDDLKRVKQSNSDSSNTSKITNTIPETNPETDSSNPKPEESALGFTARVIIVAAYYFKPTLFTISFTAGSLFLHNHIDWLAIRINKILGSGWRWPLLIGTGALFYKLPQQKWDIVKAVGPIAGTIGYAAYLGYRFHANTLPPPEKKEEKPTSKVAIIIQSGATILSGILSPGSNVFGLVLGSVGAPHYIKELLSRISCIWENNRLWFLAVNFGMLYALPYHLYLTTFILSSQLGNRLYFSSVDVGNQKLVSGASG